MIVSSPRQAIAYLYAHHRGPTLARPKWHDAPGDTSRSHWDGSLIGAMLRGPRVLSGAMLRDPSNVGGCGVEPDSPLDLELRHWATTAGVPRSEAVRAVERRMRAILRAHGVMPARRRIAAVRRWVDPDGAAWTRQVDPCAETRCTDGQNAATVP